MIPSQHLVVFNEKGRAEMAEFSADQSHYVMMLKWTYMVLAHVDTRQLWHVEIGKVFHFLPFLYINKGCW